MTPLTKQQKDLVELAKRGGNDAELLLLDKINELEKKIEESDNKISSLKESIIDQGVANDLEKKMLLLGENIKKDKSIEEIIGRIATRLAVKIAIMEKGDKGDSPTDEELRTLIIPLIPAPLNGTDGADGLDGKDADEEKIIEGVLSKIKLPEYKETVLDTPEQLREKLELLKGDDRLDKTAIKGLEEDIKALNEKISSVSTRRGGAGGPNANAIQFADLTAQCNGSTKSFSVPRHRVALMLCGTQFPIIYRNITDFTTANLTLTLTAQVSAPDTGQSLIFLYVK